MNAQRGRIQTHEMDVRVSVINPNYVNEFIHHYKSAADMLAAGLFPNAKEITESMAAWSATKRFFKEWSRNNGRIQVVAVADGHRPRTAAIFAFRTAWNCHAVDPVLRPIEYGFDRMALHPVLIEEFRLESDHPVLIVAVHSHAKLPEAVKAIKAPHIGVIAIACCVNQELFKPADAEYEDMGIWSPKRLVKVWRNVQP